jgi:DNA-directed RNA polymerase beta' subunit
VQDGLLGSYNLTAPTQRIDWRSAINIMSYTSVDDFKYFKKNKEYTGHELFSLIIPSKINIDRSGVKIKNGKLTEGQMSSEFLGPKKKNALHQLIWDEYGVEETRIFLDNIQRLTNNFNLFNGFSCGMGDVDILPEVESQINKVFQTKELKVCHMISELENNPELMAEDLFEKTLLSELNVVKDDVSKLVMNNMSSTNNIGIMAKSGSKGDATNIGQMSGCIGLQAVEGKLIAKKFNKRTLSYYFQNDDRAKSRGLIKKSFRLGMDYPEFFYLNMAGREGLIDQAIKSVTGDTPIVILENGQTKRVNIGDWIDEYLLKYPNDIQKQKEKDMELLKLKGKAKVYIPTCDDDGNITWGEMTIITRHDPTEALYEIKTRGGRRVIVADSKSLIIWNSKTNKFEDIPTPDVKIGDFAPATMSLCKPPIINKYISNKLYERFELNEENGIFIGLFLANGNVSVRDGCVEIFNNEKNIREWTTKWFENHEIKYNGYSSLLAQFLTKLVGNGSANNYVPDEAFNAPNEFIIGLINGYISGAGTISKNSIDMTSASYRLVEGINMLLSRLGIYGKITKTSAQYRLSVRKQWTKIFSEKIGLLEQNKHKKLKILGQSEQNGKFKIQNDVVLDEITEITKVDKSKYKKLYDVTVPSTFNFCTSDGLALKDTAESGYIQRKLVKSMEDIMVKYDGTVRSGSNAIIQFVYGDSGADTVKQYEYNMNIIKMGDKEIVDKYKIKDSDLKTYKISKNANDDFYKEIIGMRDLIRSTQIKSRMNYITINSIFMLPVNLLRIIDNIRNDDSLKTDKNNPLEGEYIISKLNEILNNKYTTLMCIRKEDINNKKSFKYNDEQVSKTALKVSLYDSLAPSKCFYEYNLNKAQFDEIINQIMNSYNENIIEAGEMTGVLGAQSMGEPVTQLNLNAFHSTGIAAISNTTQGVPRVKELLSLTKNLKTPQMIIYMTKEYMANKEMVNKVASYIRYTTLGDVRKNLIVYFDPEPYREDGYMTQDHIKNVYYTHSTSKNSCQADINSLPWLIRIELDREKMFENEVTLLDIKSKFCNAWEKRYADMKNAKKEERYVIDKITQLAILSNTDNDKQPVLHIRFDMSEYDVALINDFIDFVIDKFKLKGIASVSEIVPIEERVLTFDGENHSEEKNKQYVLYTIGTNLDDIRYINGIDIYKTICNDVVAMYEAFGIEAARATLAREITYAFERAGSSVNYHHLSILVDMMTSTGNLTSVDRHGMNKSDSDPFGRASFEKTVDQLTQAAVFGEVDHMKGVSSRIMAGLVIRGGTGACDVVLDTDMLEKSEFTEDIGQKYEKTFVPIIENNVIEHLVKADTEANMFIPE